MSTKKTGTKGMARSVEESMPPKTTVPMRLWLAAPAPPAVKQRPPP